MAFDDPRGSPFAHLGHPYPFGYQRGRKPVDCQGCFQGLDQWQISLDFNLETILAVTNSPRIPSHSRSMQLLTKPTTAALSLLMSLSSLAASPPDAASWTELIEGRNLAQGKEAILSPVPLYRRTTTGKEPFKLTDGQWKDEALVSSKSAVGWNYLNSPVNIIIDLGEEQSVGTIVARFLGGERDSTVVMPRKVTVALSHDGSTYYEAASLTKVNGGESELAEKHPDRYIYRPETGTYFVHPYTLKIDRKARYVALTVQAGVHNIFCDEIFIMEARDKSTCHSLDGLEKTTVLSKGIEVRPKSGDRLFITSNVVTPNYFYIADMRSDEEKKTPVRVFLDLPAGITVKTGWKGTAQRDANAPEGVNRWSIDQLWDPSKPDWQGAEGPVYLIADEGLKLPEDATATFYSDEKDSGAHRVTVPVALMEVPEVPPLKNVHMSLTWMSEKDHSYLYPDFFRSFRHVGFTGIGMFPRNAKTEEDQKQMAQFANDTRAHGLQVVYNESAFNVMVEAYAKHPEIFNQIGGKPGKALCPTYTGPYYDKEIERVADHARLIHPDIIFHDTELWYRGHGEWQKCSRCKEAFNASGMKNWDAFMLTQGTRMTRDLHKAVEGTRADGGTPLKGNYNVVAAPPIYHKIYDFGALYPDYFDFGMPVLYVRGDVARVHDTIRENYLAMGNHNIIPWMTAGTYGEFPPVKTGQMILEALLNGAQGITYYRFQDHDPMDYYHQAVALSAIAPHEALLKEGKLLTPSSTNPALSVTLWGTGKEALLLVGHYQDGGKAESTSVTLPGGKIATLKPLLGKAVALENDAIPLILEPGEHRLFHVTFTP